MTITRLDPGAGMSQVAGKGPDGVVRQTLEASATDAVTLA
jgi:hypothetical protein